MVIACGYLSPVLKSHSVLNLVMPCDTPVVTAARLFTYRAQAYLLSPLHSVLNLVRSYACRYRY